MNEDFTKKPKLSSMFVQKLEMLLTSVGIPTDIITKIKEILVGGDGEKEDPMKMDHPDGESKKEDGLDVVPETEEKETTPHDLKKKLSLNGIKVVCITE